MPLNVVDRALNGVFLLKPDVFGDARGFFLESWRDTFFADATGVDAPFVQDNHSRSSRGILRGLHYQVDQVQGKLVRALSGAIFDVAVDLRRSSPTFGQWYGAELTADNFHQLWVPPGFAHGFVVLSETADVAYKTTGYWSQAHERCLRWDDPDVGIAWPDVGGPSLNDRDANAPLLADQEGFA